MRGEERGERLCRSVQCKQKEKEKENTGIAVAWVFCSFVYFEVLVWCMVFVQLFDLFLFLCVSCKEKCDTD